MRTTRRRVWTGVNESGTGVEDDDEDPDEEEVRLAKADSPDLSLLVARSAAGGCCTPELILYCSRKRGERSGGRFSTSMSDCRRSFLVFLVSAFWKMKKTVKKMTLTTEEKLHQMVVHVKAVLGDEEGSKKLHEMAVSQGSTTPFGKWYWENQAMMQPNVAVSLLPPPPPPEAAKHTATDVARGEAAWGGAPGSRREPYERELYLKGGDQDADLLGYYEAIQRWYKDKGLRFEGVWGGLSVTARRNLNAGGDETIVGMMQSSAERCESPDLGLLSCFSEICTLGLHDFILFDRKNTTTAGYKSGVQVFMHEVIRGGSVVRVKRSESLEPNAEDLEAWKMGGFWWIDEFEMTRERHLKLFSYLATVLGRFQSHVILPANPSSMLSDPLAFCSGCMGTGALKVCGRCKKVAYCSKMCQHSHWKSGHKSECAQVLS